MQSPLALTDLLAAWPADEAGTRDALAALSGHALSFRGASLTVIERPGVSLSFRFAAPRSHRPDRPLFFLVDVVLPASEPRFLSACFYEDEIADPDDRGNAVPQGLFDETGHCFDLEAADPGLLDYLRRRIAEAFRASTGSAR